MSGGSIRASLECQCCFWIAGGLVPYRTMWLLTLLLFKNSIDTQGKLRLNLHSLSVSERLDRVRTKLESPWMSLNLKTKIQGLECPWICKHVLQCPWILLALVFGYFLKLFDIQDGHFVELILHVHIWPHYKVTFWTIQRQILLISNAFFFSI
jgi:hypothetical protein